ncbi:MAG TPA: adenosylcobinamide amidohydrolase, partial [Ktedonobacteraceae bacterium]|nr:adenosylcobinamide amidohydrolase [Ktedonobacteraceae bacterium]
TVASVITAGVSNAVAAGVSEPAPLLLSTINIVVLIDASLVQSALVNAVITATEAKTGALMAQAVRTVEGHAATGTSTDAIVIACTGRGAPLPYAGPVTRVGHLIAASVRQCLAQALHLQKEKG